MKDEYFTEIMKREKRIMFRLAYDILLNTSDAEDAISEGIKRAWEYRFAVRDTSKLGTWMTKIVVNEAKKIAKRRNREMPMEKVGNRASKKDKTDEEKVILWDTVHDLPKDQQTVIVLFYYQQYSIKEIAEIVNKPVGTVKYLLSIARKELRNTWIGKEQNNV